MNKINILFIIVVLFTESFVYGQGIQKDITLEDIFSNRKFSTARIGDYISMNDGEHYCVWENDSLNIFDYKTGSYKKTVVTTSQLTPPGDTIPISIDKFYFSQDEGRILLTTETEKIYRRSTKSNYYIYDIGSKDISPLSDGGKQRLATFSPDGSKVAFVRNNNIFIKDINSKVEYAITFDGLYNNIVYGATDWVYEEEFGFTKAFFWSPDGSQIAFYRFDETNVKEFQMTIWGKLYPEVQKLKYPKAGEENSIINILIYNLKTKITTEMDIGNETDIYIPRVKWTNNANNLAIQWMNRHQNELKILLANSETGETQSIYHETNKYYINITNNLTFLKNDEDFIFTSEMDGYNHIYLYDIDGNLINQITYGNYDISKFIGVNESKGLVYYTSSESSPINRELYVIKLDGTGKKLLSKNLGNNSVKFSKNYKYFINTYSNANTPPLVTINSSKGKQLRIITDNSNLNETIDNFGFCDKKFFQFRTSDDVELNGWMIKPSNFDPSKKYPILMYVYGGPGSQTVRNSWGRGSTWYQMLAQKGIIIVSVDNRGTGARGEEFKKMTYLQLGKYETIDQIEAAKYLGSLDYVDANRIGIWGWSYGGYMTLSCLTKGANYFSMGIAVAPVTTWRYYDNIYTERFMQTPQENPNGFDDNSPINHVEKLKGNLLLIHGTADDNVHVQNSIDFISAMVSANKPFDMQLYPNSNHGIYTGKNTTLHLYTRMTGFIYGNLLKNFDE